jgi:hypothetical protein
MQNSQLTAKGISAGFCSLLFGGAPTVPYAVSPSLSSLLSTFRDRSLGETYAFDQSKICSDLKNALVSFPNEQTQR